MGQVQSWISVRNFDKYQHYKTRRPPWVKLYREILTDYELASLPVSTRWLAVVLLLLASETDPRNVIPLDRAWLATRSSLTRGQVADGIKRLASKNVAFVRVSRRPRRKHRASTPLAECYGTSTEKEIEVETPVVPLRQVATCGNVENPKRSTCPICSREFKSVKAHLRNSKCGTQAGNHYDMRDYA